MKGSAKLVGALSIVLLAAAAIGHSQSATGPNSSGKDAARKDGGKVTAVTVQKMMPVNIVSKPGATSPEAFSDGGVYCTFCGNTECKVCPFGLKAARCAAGNRAQIECNDPFGGTRSAAAVGSAKSGKLSKPLGLLDVGCSSEDGTVSCSCKKKCVSQQHNCFCEDN